jgi:hypothetical protein
MADFPTAPKRTEICDSCGKPITIEVGITYVGSTDGRFWHYGCARENSRPAISSLGDDEMVERVARAIAGAQWDRACTALGIPNYPREGNWSALLPEARAAIAAMTG